MPRPWAAIASNMTAPDAARLRDDRTPLRLPQISSRSPGRARKVSLAVSNTE